MSNSVVRIYSVSSDYSVQHFSENELSRKNPSPGRSTLSFPMVPCWLEMKTNLSQRKRFWFQLFGAYFRTLSVAITHTPLPVLLLCRRLPNRNNFFCCFVCYLILGASSSYQTPIYAASEHLQPDHYKPPPLVAVAGMPTTWTESPAAEDLSDPWGIPVAVGEKRLIPTGFVLYKTTSLLTFSSNIPSVTLRNSR